jgi:5-dehydro-2-deoxygluconokinase
MALDAAAISEAFIARLPRAADHRHAPEHPGVLAASQRALGFAQRHGVLRVLDIDYRPVLWGLTRAAKAPTVSWPMPPSPRGCRRCCRSSTC